MTASPTPRDDWSPWLDAAVVADALVLERDVDPIRRAWLNELVADDVALEVRRPFGRPHPGPPVPAELVTPHHPPRHTPQEADQAAPDTPCGRDGRHTAPAGAGVTSCPCGVLTRVPAPDRSPHP